MATAIHTYPTQAYQDTEVMTADPRRRVVLLFDSMVRELCAAREAMAQRDYHGQCTSIVRTQRILSVLASALQDGEAPGIARALGSLYHWAHAKLTEASLSDDEVLLAEITQIIVGLRDAWREAELQCRGAVS
ncbi:MAG: flagellar export chaperone FliS [Armatimonadetes bacterium]|nr:flagellar export chaperone FliS [Armatimonadota bacterium]